ncbi:hypothetical protein Scep_028086 [Stephania cephalantha]|uniref:Uncharacterized protein n=1 Tax=Stephania cephalantha TaxID=152367 RepID=A0AAP0EHM6_9MAGN
MDSRFLSDEMLRGFYEIKLRLDHILEKLDTWSVRDSSPLVVISHDDGDRTLELPVLSDLSNVNSNIKLGKPEPPDLVASKMLMSHILFATSATLTFHTINDDTQHHDDITDVALSVRSIEDNDAFLVPPPWPSPILITPIFLRELTNLIFRKSKEEIRRFENAFWSVGRSDSVQQVFDKKALMDIEPRNAFFKILLPYFLGSELPTSAHAILYELHGRFILRFSKPCVANTNLNFILMGTHVDVLSTSAFYCTSWVKSLAPSFDIMPEHLLVPPGAPRLI